LAQNPKSAVEYIRDQCRMTGKKGRTNFNTTLRIKEDIIGLDIAVNDGLAV